MVTVILIVIFVLGVSLPAIYHFRRRRRDERLVRIWVDEHHYALLSFHGPKGWHTLFPGAGLFSGIGLGVWIYELSVQDEQGGQLTFEVGTSFLGRIRTRRW